MDERELKLWSCSDYPSRCHILMVRATNVLSAIAGGTIPWLARLKQHMVAVQPRARSFTSDRRCFPSPLGAAEHQLLVQIGRDTKRTLTLALVLLAKSRYLKHYAPIAEYSAQEEYNHSSSESMRLSCSGVIKALSSLPHNLGKSHFCDPAHVSPTLGPQSTPRSTSTSKRCACDSET